MRIPSLKNIDRKKAGKAALGILIVSVFLLTVGFTRHKQSVMLCSQVHIVVDDSTGLGFVDANDVLQLVHDKAGRVTGMPMESINISMLEKIINNDPFIAHAEVFSTVDGKLNIVVKQRRPAIRIINFNNESYYIDDKGEIMPLSDKYTALVPVANGFLFDRESERSVRKISEEQMADTGMHVTRLERVFRVADFLQNHPFWEAQIEQIYVNEKGELELIPRVGSHSVLIGEGKDLEKKFENLFLFYKEGLNKTGWNQYSIINLKYENQVVCTKK